MEKKKTSYIDKLAERIEVKSQKVSMYIETFVLGLSADLHAKNRFAFEPFGTFAIKKHLEYIKENEDGTKTLYPPRLEVEFASSAIAAVLISSTAAELENTYREFFERCDFNEEMTTAFISQMKTSLKSLLLQDKFVEIPYLGTFEGELGGELIFAPAEYFANLINKPFSYFEPELIVGESQEDEEIIEEETTDEKEGENVSIEDKQSTIASLSPLKREEAKTNESNISLSENRQQLAKDDSEAAKVSIIPQEKQSESLNNAQSLIDQLLKEKEKQIADRDILLKDKDRDLRYYRRLSLLLIIVLILMIVGLFYLKVYSPNFIKQDQNVENSNLEVSAKDVTKQNNFSSLEQSGVTDSLIIASAVCDTIQKDSVNMAISVEKESVLPQIMEDDSLKYVYHKLKRGETLREISYKYYQNRDDWTILVDANQAVIKDPNRIPIGEIIRIPKKPQ